MTLRERLQIIGQVWKNGKPEPEVIYKEKNINAVLGGFFENTTKKLSNEKTISSKLLNANKEWVYRNNDVIAKEVSNIEFELYTIGLKGGEEEYQEVDEHPLLDILDQFNGSTTKSDAIYVTQSHKKLTGDAFWLVDDEGIPGTPTYNIKNIYILPPDKIELVIGDPTDASDELVEAYKYKDQIDGKSIEKIYKPEKIIHFKTPNPNNMFRGYGAVEAAASVIDLDNLTNETTRKFFENGAITNFVLSTENKITDEQLKRLKAELRAAYTGASKAFQTMILGGGLKPENISYTNKDLEFMAQLEWYRDKIMIIFGNTKASLGIIDDVNRASHESSIISWKRNTVKPDMEAIVNTLNEFLVPRFGGNLVLGFCEPVPEDRSALLEEAKVLFTDAKKPIITRNEARKLLDYDEVPGEDELQDLSIPEPAATPPEALRSIDLKRVLRKQGVPAKKKEYTSLRKEAEQIARKIVHGRRKKEVEEVRIHPLLSNETIDSYYSKQIKIVEVLEQRFQNALEQYIQTVVDKALTNVDGEISKAAQKQLFDEEELVIQATLDFRPILTEVAVAAGQQAYNLINVDDPYIPLNIRSVIDKNVKRFATSMLETDRDLLIDIISEGLKEGQSVVDIRRSITEKFDVYTKTQAERITRTEVIRASNQATLDAFEQSGVVEGKQWYTAKDGRVDAVCAQYDGRIETSLSGSFYKSENEFQDGDPPLHPNCRCVLLPVLEGRKSYNPVTSIEREAYQEKITELEAQIDKRTKSYRDIKQQYRKEAADDQAYIKALENHLGVSYESTDGDPEA